MGKKHFTFSAVLFLTMSTMAFGANNDGSTGVANLGADPLTSSAADSSQGPQAGQRYTLSRDAAFTIIRNNVPKAHNPNAAEAGQAIILPANTVLDIISTSVTPDKGALVRLAPDEPGNNSLVPSDFEVLASEFVASGANLENIAMLDSEIEDQAANMTVADAVTLDLVNQTDTAAVSHARGRSAGASGHHSGGMTYCLQNVEVKAAALGICPYKISEGYARRSLDGFETICHMVPTAYSANLPMGSICVSHGTNGHICDGAPCGDTKMKTGQGWYNGVGSGYSVEAGIGAIIGCVVPGDKADAASEKSADAKSADAKTDDSPAAKTADATPAKSTEATASKAVASASKAPAKKAPARAPVRRAAVRRAPVRRATVSKAPVRRVPVKRTASLKENEIG
jgi:hypothetical protein